MTRTVLAAAAALGFAIAGWTILSPGIAAGPDRSDRTPEEIAYLERCDADWRTWRAANPQFRFRAGETVERVCDCRLDIMERRGITIAEVEELHEARQAMKRRARAIMAEGRKDMAGAIAAMEGASLAMMADFDMRRMVEVGRIDDLTRDCPGAMPANMKVSNRLRPTSGAIEAPTFMRR